MNDFIDLRFVLLEEKIFPHQGVDLILKTDKILGEIILIHTDIFEFEIDKYAVVSEVIGKFKELNSEVFDEFGVDIRNPGLDFDGDVFEEEVETGVLFEELLQFDDVRIDEILDFFGLEEHVLLLKGVKLDPLAHHYFLFLQH
jgi:hypothetical protein